MSLSWSLPLPIVAMPGNSVSLSVILQQSFGWVPRQFANAWLYGNSAQDLVSWDFRYWNPAATSLGAWYLNGTAITPDSSKFVTTASFGSAVFVAGNNIGSFADVFAGSAWYSMTTVDLRLINAPANNQEPTPGDIVSEAYRFNSLYGLVPNDNDCHNIAREVAAAVGATLGPNSGSLDPTQNQEGGFWRIAYRGSGPNPVSNWHTLVQPGDIVRMGWTAGGQHTTTILGVNADGSMLVYDNGDWDGGFEGIGVHTVFYDRQTIASTITIYRLTSDHLYLQVGDDAGDTIAGSVFNDRIIGGAGNDSLSGGPGNDVIDGGGGFNTAYFVGSLSQYQIVQTGNNAFQVTDLSGGSPDGSDQLSNIERLSFADRYESAPVDTASSKSATHNQSFAATSLFSTTDADNDAITAYQFWDSTVDAGSGYWIVGGNAQPASQAINVTSTQLATATFQAGWGSDHLWVRAFDGILWGAWTDFYVNAPADHLPVVTATNPNVTAARFQSFAATSLFSVADADNDTITAYQFWDSTADPASGHWVVGGAAQPASQTINVTPAQLSSATFQSESGSDDLWVRAFDGALWGAWTEFHVNAPVDHLPVVTAGNTGATHMQIIAVGSLFSVSDGDNDPIVAYQFWDSTADPSSGHWIVGGAAQPAGQAIDVTPAQLSSATFQSGSGSDQLWVRANDGMGWGAWQGFLVNAPIDSAPVVTPVSFNTSVAHGASLTAGSLVHVSDTENDTITAYQFWDSTPDPASGHWIVGGAAQPAGQAIDVTAAQFSSATFQSGSGSDHVWVRANDGITWGAWQDLYVNAPIDNAPVVSGNNTGLTLGNSITVGSLFSVTDVEHDTITQYELWDSANTASSGHFAVGSTVQPTGQGIFLDVSQYSQTSFVASSTPAIDRLWERAYDGSLWSDWAAINVTSHV